MKSGLPSRRDFLWAGATGLASAATFTIGACTPSAKKDERTKKLVYRTLGRTGMKIPVVSMGSIYAIDLVRAALDEGIVHIHTSSGYAERNHERMLGELFRDIPRESFVIATSPDLPYPYTRRHSRSLDLGKEADPKLISESLEGSLQRLGLDYVDIFYLLSIGSVETVQYEPYMKEFEKLRRDGKTRAIGVGTHENEPAIIRAATDSGLWDVILTAYNFRQSHRQEVRAAIAHAAGAGLGVVAMKTQAGVYWDRTRLQMINMKAALKWVLQNENVHTTIPAFANYEEMHELLSVMENLGLTREEEEDLRLGDSLGLSGLYCQQCGVCVEQCPSGLDVPTLMRSHMYAFGHRQPGKAKDTLRSWKVADISCVDCSSCEVTCSLGMDVKSSISEIAPIIDVPEKFLA